MKLTYWVAECQTASTCYNIREATRKAVIAERIALSDPRSLYSEPFKVVVEYKNALDLVRQCLGEGGVEYPMPKPFRIVPHTLADKE